MKKTCLSKIINDGVLNAELDRFFQNELAECGYTGLNLRCAPNRYEIILRVTKTQATLGVKGQRIRELTSALCLRFSWAEKNVVIFVEQVLNRGLSAAALAESIKYKMLEGVAVRRAVTSANRYAMQSGAQGIETIVSGKISGQRAKAMKFVDGLMIHSGQSSEDYIEKSKRSVQLRQGSFGVQVRVMKPQDPTGNNGPRQSLPDKVIILQPKEDKIIINPYSESKIPLSKVEEIETL